MTDQLLSDTSFKTAGEYYLAGTGNIAMPWGTDAEVKYNVGTDTIHLSLPDGRSFDFDTPGAGQGLPFATQHTYQIKDASSTVLQQFYVSPPIVGGVALTYTRWGSFIDMTSPPPGETVTASFFFGVPTTSMPTSGSATYDTTIIATGSSNGTHYSYSANSTATFSADFGAGTVSTALTLKGVPSGGGSARP